MSNTSVPVTRATEGDFRVGRVFDRTLSVYTRNFLIFSVVTLVASAPPLLITGGAQIDPANPDFGGGRVLVLLLAAVLTMVLGLLSQAILVYGAFQDMRGRPVNLSESINVGLSRFFPIIGLTLLAGLGLMIGFILLFIPGLMLIVRWFVAVPVCMVERVGAWQCLKRSSDLTKGHRWKVFGIILLLYLGAGVVSQVIAGALTAIGGSMLALFATLIWNTIWGAFFAIFVVVTYYELRVAKEGIDIEQIASVFD